jgi:tRNA(Leu) C34 or U34 (ribose-2'-O)-methylase TrmL
MITNSKLTIYHRDGLDIATHQEIWKRFNYDNVWFFGGEGAGINKGYDNANNVEIRIPYDQNANLSVSNFAIGDIIVQGKIETDITRQQDLKGTLIYNITSISNNNFGNNQHIHIGGK